MNGCLDGSKCLASLAVFRELYNSHKDVYAIISEFLIELIVTNGKHQFNLTEITTLLNKTYDFHIPEAVVKSSLNRLNMTKSNGYYIVNQMLDTSKIDIRLKQSKIQNNNDSIIKGLLLFIETENNVKLSEDDKTKIVHSFCSFLLDDSNGKNYSEYISAYILKNQLDQTFKTQLNTIKEGVILYSGIKYNNNLADVGSWKINLTIFIDTEILFHFAGYNGELYKSLFNDFFSYVKEINQQNGRRIIQLKYFREVKDEIERFFKKAEHIVTKAEIINPRGTAMSYIIDGCTSASDVIGKKSDFFQLLNTSGIAEDDYQDYYKEYNYKYNIIEKEVIGKVLQTTGIDDISECIKYLNYVSIHRKDSNNSNFENIGYVLLTGDYKTIQVAWHDEIKNYGNVPLATTLNFITNKFWFKLNKGFGDGNYPKSFDIITKAQIVLSAQLNDSVGRKYDELQTKYKKGELTKNQAAATIVALRNQAKKPEEISGNDVLSILESITEESIEKFIHEHEHLKNKVNIESEENTKLKQRLDLTENQLKEKELIESAYAVNTIHLKEQLFAEKSILRSSLENHKIPIDKMARNKYLLLKIYIITALIIYYIVLFCMIWKATWNVMEQWTYIIGVIPIVLSFMYLVIFEKIFNPITFFENKKNKYRQQKYKEFNFDIERLNSLYDEERILKSEIEELKRT